MPYTNKFKLTIHLVGYFADVSKFADFSLYRWPIDIEVVFAKFKIDRVTVQAYRVPAEGAALSNKCSVGEGD